MSAWLLGTTGLRARIDDTLDPRLASVLESLQALGASIEIYFLPTSVCGATVLALALGDGERWPGATLGLACHLEPARALRQAILELGQTGPYLRRVLHARLAPIPGDALAVREMFDHALYYFSPDRVSAFDALRGGHEVIALHDLLQSHGDRAVAKADMLAADALAACAGSLRAAGVGVALVDVTSPDVALGDLTVVRAVSLDLQDISYGHGLDRAPVSRLAGRVRPMAASSIHPIW